MTRLSLHGTALVMACGLCACGSSHTATPVADAKSGDTQQVPTGFTYDVPLSPTSPWPKFRRNAHQDGRSPIVGPGKLAKPWIFPTAKGIFSSPIVGGDETVYIGSADRFFYALKADGTLRWKFETGEIIDSSGLLDDQGRVYFASGDGHLYARDAATGSEVWTFTADDPKTTKGFIRWFEGNVAIGGDGTLLVPNDNFRIYALDRKDASVRWTETMHDQTWSLPAVDVASGLIVHGNNNLLQALGDNVFAVHTDGSAAWSASIAGTVAASPLWTQSGLIVIGGFDGYVHAYDAKTGAARWSFGTRDHVYASAAEQGDGTIVIPSSDGTIYALNPTDGSMRWAFDALEPFRASPAIDGAGRTYVGGGDGKLYVLEADGRLRFSMRLIDGDRNDLNASPALGRDAVYLAGETGEIFAVPYDWCLRPEAASDARCEKGGSGTGEALPADGTFLLFTTRYGSPLPKAPASIDANQALAFSLFVRKGGDTPVAVLDTASLQVSSEPSVPLSVHASGDRRFLTVTPQTAFAPGKDAKVTLSIKGQWLSDPERNGLATTGGKPAGSIDTTFTFDLSAPGGAALPLPVPATAGDDAGLFALTRLAAPLPTILPSYNQIGFDSLHWLIGVVEGNSTQTVGWMIGAMPTDTPPGIAADPATKALFPVTIHFDAGKVTFENHDGLALEVMNASIAFQDFRVSGRLDASGKALDGGAVVHVATKCADINFYGMFLEQLGFCNPDDDLLVAYGAALLGPAGSGVQKAPGGLGTPSFLRKGSEVRVNLAGSTLQSAGHRLGLLLLDPTTRLPLAVDYGLKTTQEAATSGALTSVSLDVSGAKLPATVRAWLMVDAYPAAVAELGLP